MTSRLERPGQLVALFLCAVISSCADAGPSSRYAVEILSGGSVRDTVLAPTVTLAVRMHDRDGSIVPNLPLVFLVPPAVPADSTSPRRGAYVCALDTNPCATFHPFSLSAQWGVQDTTDTNGVAQIHVQAGIIAGTAEVTIEVPGEGRVASIPVVTLPGRLARITAVGDTAIQPGKSFALGARSTDRVGNPLADPVTVTALTPAVVVCARDTVTALAPGRGMLVLANGAATDTAFVSVPPSGRLVMFGWSPDFSTLTQLTLINTDGSGRRVILASPGQGGNANPVWTPDGAAIVFSEQLGAGAVSLIRTDTVGHRRDFLSNGSAFTNTFQPAASADHVYFYGMRPDGSSGVYSALPDGSGVQSVFPGVQPAPSPDGTRVAYINNADLMVRTVATGGTVTLATFATMPRWSPDGAAIAFQSGNAVSVIGADGTGLRTLATTGYGTPLAWSPDAAWIAMARWNGGLSLIRVADGTILPIAGTSDLFQPAWRPIP